MFNLTGKVALVTGATGAIGKAISMCLHKAGATLAISGTKTENLEKLAEELSGHVHFFQCDLSNTSDVKALVPSVESACGRVDILVNNAGITRDGLLLRMSDEAWHDVMKVNLEAPFQLMKAVSKGMMREKWGRIINISSIVGAIGNPGQTNYAASKSAMFGLSKSLARELASRNVTVNCVAPGFIESPMTEQIPRAHKEHLEKNIPLCRVGTPEEVAAAVVFLASREASYITGQILHVNGGLAMV
jgi:3-oxoacyl-[acyl-carrier protein] reductase